MERSIWRHGAPAAHEPTPDAGRDLALAASPGERYDSQAHPEGVTETLTVMRGQMVLVLGDTTQPLRVGRTTGFAANAPHAYQGAGRGPCELIMTVHLPPEPYGA